MLLVVNVGEMSIPEESQESHCSTNGLSMISFRRKKNMPEKLFQFLNNYHQNIKLTCEISPEKSLGNNNTLKTAVFRY